MRVRRSISNLDTVEKHSSILLKLLKKQKSVVSEWEHESLKYEHSLIK